MQAQKYELATEVNIEIKKLDGSQLYYSFLSGAKRIFDNQKLLNKINVFPVSDADTGTNLASTMRSIIDAIIPTDSPKQTAVALADAALNGARGNSGIIFAQFLYGFSNEIKTDEAMDVRSFAESMRNAVNYAYEAISNPVEGTILTVIREWADYLYAVRDIFDDFIKILNEAYQKAKESLSETSKKLEVLARNHVVDAGAKGFVVFLEGFLDFLIKGNNEHENVAVVETLGEAEDLDQDTITYRYCSEALIAGENLNQKVIHDHINHCGDSLVIAGSPKKMRVHIHTDYPAELFSHLKRFGDITYQKVDDMVMQKEIRHHRKSEVAILTDSACDLPDELVDRYQIQIVPLTVHFGNTFYLDRITLKPSQFYSLLKDSDFRPSSAQPSYKDFVNKYEFLGTHYESVIGLNMSQALSGTFFNSEKAAIEVSGRSGKKMKAFNSRSLTAGLGLLVLRVARELDEGKSYDEVVAKIDGWIDKIVLRVSVPTLNYIIKSGRVNPFKGFIARILDLKPVIAVNKEGKTTLLKKSLSEQNCMKNLINEIRKTIQGKKVWEYAITQADNPEAAEWYAIEMEKLTGKKPLFINAASPVMGTHTGPGVAAVSLMLE
ncbi:MAG: DegV family protein [Bacteroidota bacterium]|nr:DegV family protein [Bacteroidota bacterium]